MNDDVEICISVAAKNQVDNIYVNTGDLDSRAKNRTANIAVPTQTPNSDYFPLPYSNFSASQGRSLRRRLVPTMTTTNKSDEKK